MSYLPRALAAKVRQACRTFPAVLVTGARQSGKTTLLREEFGGTHRFTSLERPDVRARATADPVSFLRENPPPVILDEIQYVPELLHYVKERIDEQRKPGSWLLSGSQSLPLMRGVSQTLAGRVAVLTLDPLSVREAEGGGDQPVSVEDALGHIFGPETTPRRARTDLGDWLLRGGYPELRASPEVDRQLWFASYVQTYLQRDVRDLLQVGDLGTFSRFLSLAAARTGLLLNLADLARDVGVSPPTVRRWLSVLEASQVIYLLRPYHRSFGKRLVKSPRLVFTDPGLASFLVALHDRDAILSGPSAGALAETAVVGEWLKLFRQQGEEPSLYFWRSAAGLEVDLVIERNRRLYGIEVKATATPTPGQATSLARWLALAGDSARGALACRIEAPESLRPGIRAVPWHLAWL
jgi:predicted AAA+ superfamily ATPase